MDQPPSNVQDGSIPTQHMSQLVDASAAQTSPAEAAATPDSQPIEPENDKAWMSEMVQGLLHTEVRIRQVSGAVLYPPQQFLWF